MQQNMQVILVYLEQRFDGKIIEDLSSTDEVENMHLKDKSATLIQPESRH